MKRFIRNVRQDRWVRPTLLVAPLLIQLLLPGRASALDPAKNLKQYNCRTWNRQAGLPATSINAIAQTRDGYLWFGTSAGLLRFDGTEFKVLDLHSVAALRTSYVTSLASARSGGLWVGLEHSAFGFYDGQSFSFRGAKVVALDVQSLLESRNGTLWLAAEQQAARWTAGELETILPSDAFTNTTANAKCVYEDRQGRVWFGTLTQGVFYWQDGKITKLPAPELEGTPVYCITEDLAGQIWIGSQNGLYCYDASLKRREIPPLPSAVSVLLVDRHGVLWIGTSWDGLARYQNGKYDFFLKTDGLDSEAVQALYEDSEGSLWIGTGGGLDQLSDVKFPIQPATEDPKITEAYSVTAARNGGVWIASYGGVRWFDPRTKSYTDGPGLPDIYTKRVFEARNGDLYSVCGITNLVVSSGGKIVATNGAPDLVVAMTEDDQGVVVSVAGNLYRAGTNYFRPYTFKTNVPPEFYWINNLASGKDGVIWVACGNGIFRIKDGVWQHWAGPEGLVDANVQTVCEDQDGVLWAGLHSGIARLKDNQIRLISRKDGLFDNDIYAIVPDDLGNLWVDSSRGISRVARRDINAFADGKTNRVACTVFDGLDSVKTTDKTAQERVGCKTADGRIWFPGPLGVVMIDPAHMLTNPVAPPVHIERVLADGREVARNANIVVPPGNGELQFHFNASSFIAPPKVQIRYRLEGYDKDWVDAGDRRLAFYANLKPGPYTFRVIAANSDGVWNEQGDTMAISLRPHYYQTAWFLLLCGGLGFAALIGIYLQRVRHLNLKQQALQKNRDLLEAEVQKRTAELAKTNAALQEKIAERKQAEMALLESQALYESLITQVPAGLFRKDSEGRFVAANPVFCQLKGLSMEEITGKTPEELDVYERAKEAAGLLKQPPRQRMLAAQGEDHHKRIMRTGETIEVEEAYPQPDGRVEYFHVVKTPVFDAKGQVIGSQGVQFDITARKQAEQKLAESRNFLDRIINTVPDPIFVKDRQHRGVLVNDAFCQLMGLKREELLQKSDHDHDFFTPAQANEFRSKDELVFTTGNENINEETLTAADGTVHFVITKKALYTDEKGEKFIVGVIQDITDRQQAEESLRESQALYHSLVDQMPAAVFRKNAEGRYVFVNSSFCQVIGMPAEQILGKAAPELLACMKDTQSTKHLVSDKLGTQGMGHHESIMRTGRQIAVEDEYLGADGSRSYYHTVKSPVFDADGKIAGSQGILFNISDRKVAEEALQETQALYLSLVDQMPAGVYRKDKEGRFVFVNAWFCKVKGMNPDQILGRTASEIAAIERQNPTPKWLPEFANQGSVHHEQIMRTGQTIEVEEQYSEANGKTQHLHMVKSPVFDSDNRIVGTQGMLFDISAAKEAEAALSYERDLLRTLLDNSPDQIYFKDAQSRFIKTSQAQAVLFGLKSVDELVGKTDFDFFTEEHARPAFEDEQEIIRTGRPLIGKVEKEIIKNGRVSWVLTNKMPLRNKDGQIIGTFGISKNITDLKQAQEAAAYERDLLRTLLDHSPDSIYFKDLQSRLVNVSRSEAANLIKIALSRHRDTHPGESEDQLPAHLASVERFREYAIGKTDADFYGSEHVGAFNQDEREIICTGRPMIGKIEQTVCFDGSSIWHMTTKVPWRNKEGAIVGTFGTSRDITDLKNAEAKIEETHKRLLETSRHAGMAEIATNVLHNIGNVLNSVNVSASLIVDNVKKCKAASLAKVAAMLREHEHDLGTFITSDDKGKQLPAYLGQLSEQLLADQKAAVQELDLLVKNIEHIKDVVSMQQSYARVSGVKEIVNLRDLVEDGLRMNAGALDRHRVEVIREYQDVPLINVDKHRVLQILVNLIRNAKYACDESGREDRQMTVRVANGEGRIKIYVVDNGIGIPPENLTRIFNHGFTTRKDGHGFGLHSGALAAKELGGSLTAHSDGPGKGATFTLELPLQPGSTTQVLEP